MHLIASLLVGLVITVCCQGAPQLPVAVFQNRPAAAAAVGTNAVWAGTQFHLRLDEPSGTRVDASPNALDFTANNSPGNVAAQVTNGLVTASTKYLSRAYNAKFDGGTAFTLNLWMSNAANGSFQYVLSKGNYPTTFSYAIGIADTGQGDANKVRFYIAGTADQYVGSTTAVAGSTWRMITCVYDGSLSGNTSRAKVYVNGVLDTATGAGTIPASIAANNESFLVGAVLVSGSPSLYASGGVDELTFFNRALSLAEIQTIYAKNTNAPPVSWNY